MKSAVGEAGPISRPEILVLAASPLVPLLHRELDAMREEEGQKIGTTKRGIGPADGDKAGRQAP